MKKNYPFYCLLFLILTVIFFAGCNDSAEGNSSCQHIVIIDKEIEKDIYYELVKPVANMPSVTMTSKAKFL